MRCAGRCSCWLFSAFWWLFVGGERHIGAGFEELLPELGSLPDRGGMLGVLLNDGQDAGCHDSVGSAEVMVNFWSCNQLTWTWLESGWGETLKSEGNGLLKLFELLGQGEVPLSGRNSLTRHLCKSHMRLLECGHCNCS